MRKPLWVKQKRKEKRRNRMIGQKSAKFSRCVPVTLGEAEQRLVQILSHLFIIAVDFYNGITTFTTITVTNLLFMKHHLYTMECK